MASGNILLCNDLLAFILQDCWDRTVAPQVQNIPLSNQFRGVTASVQLQGNEP